MPFRGHIFSACPICSGHSITAVAAVVRCSHTCVVGWRAARVPDHIIIALGNAAASSFCQCLCRRARACLRALSLCYYYVSCSGCADAYQQQHTCLCLFRTMVAHSSLMAGLLHGSMGFPQSVRLALSICCLYGLSQYIAHGICIDDAACRGDYLRACAACFAAAHVDM